MSPVHISQESVHILHQERMSGAEITGLEALRYSLNIAQVTNDRLPDRPALIIFIHKSPVEGAVNLT